jgi:hypothetical protein
VINVRKCPAFARLILEAEPSKNFFMPGGHDNPLKTLISNKGIQGNPSFFLGKIWRLGLAWPGFERFGFGLAIASPLSRLVARVLESVAVF